MNLKREILMQDRIIQFEVGEEIKKKIYAG